MDQDIVPGLLETIEIEFDEQVLNSDKLKNALKSLKGKTATYRNANDFAIETGEILANVLNTNITVDKLPDGRMYYNIADRILNTTMKKSHNLISNYTEDVQTSLNHAAGLRMKGQKASLNQDRIDGIVNRLSSEEDFDSVKWLLGDPIVNFSQSIVDDTIKKNATFHEKAGLRPKITRKVSGHACKWCQSLAGYYEYREAPDDIYRRHERCRCTVDYDPGDGKKQDVWSKTWTDPDRDAKIEARKNIGKKDTFKYLPFTKENIGDRKRVTETIRRTKQVLDEYKREKGIDILELWKNKKFIDKENPYTDEKSKFIEYLRKSAKLDGLPKYSANHSGLQAVYRGIGDFVDGTMTADEQMEALKKGQLLVSGAKSSVHGRGIYFSTSDKKAQEYAAKGLNGKVYKYYLSDDAKILDSDVWKKERAWFNENYKNYPDAEYYQFILARNYMMDSNMDILALLTGHDVCQSGHVKNIINSGKLVFSND